MRKIQHFLLQTWVHFGNKENWQTLRRLELSKNRLMRLLEVSRDNQGSLKY